MKPIGPIRRKQLVKEMHDLLLAKKNVVILRPLADCWTEGVVPLTLRLPGKEKLSLSLLVRSQPVNFRVHHGQEHLLSMEELASLERPESCTSLLHIIDWLNKYFLSKQLRQVVLLFNQSCADPDSL